MTNTVKRGTTGETLPVNAEKGKRGSISESLNPHMTSASWVIVRRATNRAVFETFDAKLAAAINLEKYEVVPILQYLYRLNDAIKAYASEVSA